MVPFLNSPALPIDPDAREFCARSGATDVKAISAFVKGCKRIGIWSNMTCWPMQEGQNAGTGTTVHYLGGGAKINGTLVGGPTWGSTGVSCVGTAYVNLPAVMANPQTGAIRTLFVGADSTPGGPSYLAGDGVNNSLALADEINGGAANPGFYIYPANGGASLNPNNSLFSRQLAFCHYGNNNKSTFGRNGQVLATNNAPDFTTNPANVSSIQLTTSGNKAASMLTFFGAVITQELTAEQHAAFWNLYLATLSKGLFDYDVDAAAFVAATNGTQLSELSDFCKGLKSLGLWSSTVCWPMRAHQNHGTGTIIRSLGGLGSYNGTMTNGPTWGTTGMGFANGMAFVSASAVLGSNVTLFGVHANTSSTTPTSGTVILSGNPAVGGISLQYRPQFSAYPFSAFWGNDLYGAGAATTSFMGTMCSASSSGSYRRLWRAGALVAENAFGFSHNGGGITIGSAAGGEFFVGTIAMAGAINLPSDTTLAIAFYNLYKSTLGRGLSLP